MGSLRIQETYRIDPNDLRNLPPGVAWITTAGRAAKAAIAAAQARQAPPPIETRPSGNDEAPPRPGRGTPGNVWATTDGPEEIAFVEVRLLPGTDTTEEADAGNQRPHAPVIEQQTLPINEPVPAGPAVPPACHDDATKVEGPPEAPRKASPYAERL